MTTNSYRHSHTKHTEENNISENSSIRKKILQKLSLSKKNHTLSPTINGKLIVILPNIFHYSSRIYSLTKKI